MQIARSWRQQASNLRLVGTRCPSCGELAFPSRILCVSCGCGELEDYPFKGDGAVFAFTTVFEAPRNFGEQVPYLAALVTLDEGPIVSTMLADIDIDEARIGMRVTMVTRKLKSDGEGGVIVYAYKFAPPM